MVEQSHEREVIIRLILETDKGRVASAGKEIQDTLKKTQEQANRTGRAQQQQNRRTIDILRQQDREVGKLQQQHERYARAATQQQAGVTAALKQSATGALALTRSVAMLAMSGEKDLEKYLRVLIKIQLAYDALRAGAQVIGGITRAWRSYQLAVESAAAAHATLAAAQAISGATGAGVGARAGAGRGLAGPAIAGAGGYAAARGGLGGFGRSIIGGLTGAGGMTLGIGTLAALVGYANWRPEKTVEWEMGLRGAFGEGPGDIYTELFRQRRKMGMQATLRAQRQQREMEERQFAGRLGALAIPAMQFKTQAEARTALEQAQGQKSDAQLYRRVEAQIKEATAYRELIRLQGEHTAELRKQADALEDARAQRLSLRERYVMMGPLEQSRVFRAKEKMEAGKRLEEKDILSLMPFRAAPSIAAGIEAEIGRRAPEVQWEKFLGAEMKGIEQAKEILVKVAAQKFDITVQTENLGALVAAAEAKIQENREKLVELVVQRGREVYARELRNVIESLGVQGRAVGR